MRQKALRQISNVVILKKYTHWKSIIRKICEIFRCADSVQKIAENLISANGYKRVIGLSSSFGKDVIPRLAGKY